MVSNAVGRLGDNWGVWNVKTAGERLTVGLRDTTSDVDTDGVLEI